MSVEQLLEQITAINKRYEEIAKISGENFNIFNILGLTSDEKKHSKFIAMLLDPKGDHGMGDLFLKLFIKIIAIKKYDIIDYSAAKVETEKSFRNGQNGQIDILVSGSGGKIIIENKIYAEDRNEQLLRYHNYDKNAMLLYLTLNGHEPNDISKKDLKSGQHFYCVSYEDHILKWLETCRKETVNSSFLRETISQYILLVKQLTGQARSKQMSSEILNTITMNGENLKAYLDMSFLNRQDVLNDIIAMKTFPELKKIAKEKYNLEFEDTSDGFKFYKESWGKLDIWFQFGSKFSGLGYGIYDAEKKSDNAKADKGWVPDKTRMEKYDNWNNCEVIEKLFYPDNDVIREVENRLAELITEVEAMIKV
jgi:hypothetical protein